MGEDTGPDDNDDADDAPAGLPRPTVIPVPCMECRRIMWLKPGRQYVRCFDCAPEDW